MTALYEKTVGEVTENFDHKRIPVKASDRAKLDKKYRYYGAQGIIDYVDDYIFDGEYILVAEDGENLRSQKSPVCNLVSGKFWVNNHAHIIRGKDGNSSRYLCYLLNQVDFYRFTSGSAQPKLTKENLEAISLRIHTPTDQKKIAKVLATLDAKIELNNRINAELEAMAKLLYDYWFVQFDFPMTAAQAAALGQPQLEGQPYKSSGGKLVFNPTLKREIPEGWKASGLGSMSAMTRGVTYNKDDVRSSDYPDVTPVLRATNVTGNSIDVNDMVYVPAELVSEKQLMRKDDILIVMSSGSKNHIGKNAAYYFEDKVGFGAFCSKVTPKPSHKSFLKTCMQSDYFMGHIRNVCLGTNINNLTTGHISEFPTVDPEDEVLEKFERTLNPTFEMIATNQKQNQELTTLRDWLLPMLMNGQVTVK